MRTATTTHTHTPQYTFKHARLLGNCFSHLFFSIMTIKNEVGRWRIMQKPTACATHICLNELWSLLTYPRHETGDVHLLFCVHHVNHGINDDKRSCPAHASTDTETQHRRHYSQNQREYTHFAGLSVSDSLVHNIPKKHTQKNIGNTLRKAFMYDAL